MTNVASLADEYISSHGRGEISAISSYSGMGRRRPAKVRSFPYPQCHDHNTTNTVH